MMRLTFALVFLLFGCAATTRAPAGDSLPWARALGLEIAVVDGGTTVVRADGKALELVNAPASDAGVAALARDRGYALVTNAAMFAQDYRTSIGYMRNFGVVNNPRVSSRMKGFLLFHPRRAGLPAVKVGTEQELGDYDSVFQTHRMWSEAEGILWRRGASVFHHVGLVGVDGAGRLLFFFHPELVDVHDMVERILALNLGLKGLLYLDGGNHGTFHLAPELGRGWDTWLPLPNVLGVKSGG